MPMSSNGFTRRFSVSKQILKRVAISVAIVALCAPQLVFAGSPADRAPAATNARHDAWLTVFQESVERHPEWSADQLSAILDAASVGRELFTNRLGAEERALLGDALGQVKSALNCADYTAIRTGIGDNMGDWLQQNGLILATADCNCGGPVAEASALAGDVVAEGSGCATGYHCAAVNCVSTPGTTHWGRCVKD